MTHPHHRELRYTYGFDEVALVPGDVTLNPEQADISLCIDSVSLSIPVLASAMDAVVDPGFAVLMSHMGGLGVLNLEGLWTRYQDPAPILESLARVPADSATAALQKVYSQPIQEELVGQRVREIKEKGALTAVSMTPASTKRLAPLAVEAGVDIIVVQATVTTARHISKSLKGLVFSELVSQMKVPVLAGNCVTFNACLELMETGIAGVLVGVGPGAACTTREVLGVGVPQVTATMDCAAARDEFHRRTGRYIPIITDGGIRTGGDLCKAIAAGADAVMVGSPLARTREAPGKGYHWGMATFHSSLPRGTRVKVGVASTLEQLLFGPTSVTDGTQNLMGALRTAMGVCGAGTIQEMHQVEMVVAPSIKTEGKLFQMHSG